MTTEKYRAPCAGELWRVRGLWENEPEAIVMIEDVLSSGSVDANYQLDPNGEPDGRVLPAQCLISRAELGKDACPFCRSTKLVRVDSIAECKACGAKENLGSWSWRSDWFPKEAPP